MQSTTIHTYVEAPPAWNARDQPNASGTHTDQMDQVNLAPVNHTSPVTPVRIQSNPLEIEFGFSVIVECTGDPDRVERVR